MEIRRLDSHDATLARDAITALKITDGHLRRNLCDDHLRRFLSKPENYLIVATEESTPIGFVVAYLLDRVDRDKSMMFFYEIGVAESHRRRGVGAGMIKLLKRYCRQHNVMKMWVHTNESNEAAVALYESTGGKAEASGDEVTFLYTPESYAE